MQRYFVRFAVPSMVALAFATVLCAACDQSGTAPASPQLILAPRDTALPIHGRLHLTVDMRGTAQTDAAFASSYPAVATVDSLGNVKALDFGTTWIRAWSRANPELRDSMRVRVLEPTGPWLVLAPDSVALLVRSGAQLTWRLGGGASPQVQLRSSDSAVAYVDDSGLVCGRALGQAVISASAGGDIRASDAVHIAVVTHITTAGGDTVPPTMSIASIVDSAGRALPVEPPLYTPTVRGSFGVIFTLDVPRCFGRLTAELQFDDRSWASDTLDVMRGQVRDTFSVDSRATDSAGHPLLANGQHLLRGFMRTPSGTIFASTSMNIVVANP